MNLLRKFGCFSIVYLGQHCHVPITFSMRGESLRVSKVGPVGVNISAQGFAVNWPIRRYPILDCQDLRTTKTERIFEIQPHLEEHALHRKVGESHKASPKQTDAVPSGQGIFYLEGAEMEEVPD